MRSLSFSTSFLLFTIVFHSCLHHNSGQSPPPLPPCKGFRNENGCFENARLAKSYEVIQDFKTKIQDDANSVKYTNTWQGTDVCKYKGIKCDIRPDVHEMAVAGIDFNGAKFTGWHGSLPLNGFLDELDDLAIFHANSNNFTGTVPFKASRIKYLYEVDLSNNNIKGDFPMKTVGAMNLTFLDLRYNSLDGRLPSGAYNLGLDLLFINNNEFPPQKLPENIGDSPAVYLTFANNEFTGSIPRSIGEARNLLEVLFLKNKLTGCLPWEIGNLSQATVFDASSNKLTGPIPKSFGCLKNIQILNLAKNRFYGRVPEIVCELPMIQTLSLKSNYFTHVGPSCRRMIMKKKLDVKKNCIFDLPNQRSESKCSKFLSRKKMCHRPESFQLIPCLNQDPSTEKYSGEGDQAPASAPSYKTYDSLTPHYR